MPPSRDDKTEPLVHRMSFLGITIGQHRHVHQPGPDRAAKPSAISLAKKALSPELHTPGGYATVPHIVCLRWAAACPATGRTFLQSLREPRGGSRNRNQPPTGTTNRNPDEAKDRTDETSWWCFGSSDGGGTGTVISVFWDTKWLAG